MIQTKIIYLKTKSKLDYVEISDLLKDHAPEFDRKLTKIMEDTAGSKVLLELDQTFPDAEDARNWYFTYSMVAELDQKRPYDLCKLGHQDQVINELKRIRYDNY